MKEVLEGDEANEFVVQYTGLRYDGRALKHDDIVDALADSLAAVAPALGTDEAEAVASVRYDFEKLKRLPLRHCVLNEEELELLAEQDEVEAATRMKLERLLEIQKQELFEGKHDPALQRYIDTLTDELNGSKRFPRPDISKLYTERKNDLGPSARAIPAPIRPV